MRLWVVQAFTGPGTPSRPGFSTFTFSAMAVRLELSVANIIHTRKPQKVAVKIMPRRTFNQATLRVPPMRQMRSMMTVIYRAPNQKGRPTAAFIPAPMPTA